MTCRQHQNHKGLLANNWSAFATAGICFGSCIAALPAFAQSLQELPPTSEGRIEIGLGRTDNLYRDAEEIQSDIGRLELGFAGSTVSRWVRSALAADVEYRKYNADVLADNDNEVLGSVDALLELHAVPDRVQWDFLVNYGQVRIDPFGAVAPSNRQWVTSYSTGPKIGLPLGQRTLLQVGGQLSEQSYEETRELDGRTTAVLLGLERQIDSVTKLGLVLDGREIEYDLNNELNEIVTLSLEYRRELASGEALANIGQGRVKIDGEDADPVFVGQLVWRRGVGARSRIEVCLGREITDAGSAFADAGVSAGCPGNLSDLASVARTTNNRQEGGVLTSNPLVRAGGSLSFQVDGAVGNFRTTISLAQDRFEVDPTYDSDANVFEISGRRDFARHWRVDLTARIWVQDYIDRGDKNEDQYIGFSLTRLLARNMRLVLSYDQFRRSNGVNPFDADEYFLSFGRDFGR